MSARPGWTRYSPIPAGSTCPCTSTRSTRSPRRRGCGGSWPGWSPGAATAPNTAACPTPHADAAAEDAYDLADRVARGEARLFRVGLYLTVHAATEHAAGRRGRRSPRAGRRAAAGRPPHHLPRPARLDHQRLPLGLDRLGMRRTFDTDALAAAFPFQPRPPGPHPTPPTLGAAAAPAGVLYGHNLGSAGLVPGTGSPADNYNAVVLGRSGAGKSYLVKLELLRSLYRGIHALVIDPEDEYTRLAPAVGGAVSHLGAPGVQLNPFDLPLHPTATGAHRAPATR